MEPRPKAAVFDSTLIIMVGLPRSGKSTKAQLLAERHHGVIVCPDNIRLSLYEKPYIASMEPYVWAIARTMVEALFLSGHPVVILDATSLKAADRDRWASPKWLRLFFPLLNVTPLTCIQRAERTNRLDLIPVIEKMAQEFELLTPEEEVLIYEPIPFP